LGGGVRRVKFGGGGVGRVKFGGWGSEWVYVGAARPKGKIFYRLEYDAYFTELHGKIKINKR